MAAIYWC